MNRILVFLMIVAFLCPEKTIGQEQKFVQELQFTWDGEQSPLYIVPFGHMWKIPVHTKTLDGFVRVSEVDKEEVLSEMRYNGKDYSASGMVVFKNSKRIREGFIEIYSGQSVRFKSTGTYGKTTAIEYKASPIEYSFPIYNDTSGYLEPDLRPQIYKKNVVRLVLQGTGDQFMGRPCGFDKDRQYNIFIDKHEVTIISEGCYEKSFKVKSCQYDPQFKRQSFVLWNGYQVSQTLLVSFSRELNSYSVLVNGKERDDASFQFLPENELMKTILEVP